MKFIILSQKIDPLVFDLVKVGFSTYLKHIKIYLLVIISFLLIFGLITGLFYDLNLINSQNYYDLTSPFSFIELNVQYAFLALICTIISSYYIAFRKTLMTGELGMEFNLQYGKKEQFFHALVYNTLVLIYFLLWTMILKTVFILVPGMNDSYNSFNTRIAVFFLAVILVIGLIYLFFSLVVKYTYIVFMLDESKVPLKAMHPLLLLIGLFFGVIISLFELVAIVLNASILNQIIILITYLTPGIVIMPVIAYAMAHLKIASTIIGYEDIFITNQP